MLRFPGCPVSACHQLPGTGPRWSRSPSPRTLQDSTAAITSPAGISSHGHVSLRATRSRSCPPKLAELASHGTVLLCQRDHLDTVVTFADGDVDGERDDCAAGFL